MHWTSFQEDWSAFTMHKYWPENLLLLLYGTRQQNVPILLELVVVKLSLSFVYGYAATGAVAAVVFQEKRFVKWTKPPQKALQQPFKTVSNLNTTF